MLPVKKNFILTYVLVLVLSVLLLAMPGCKSSPEPESQPDNQEPTAVQPSPGESKPAALAVTGLSALSLPGEPLGEKRLDVEKVYSGGDEPGMCYLGAYAMLARFADSNIDFTDVIANSGLGVSAVYIREVNLLMNGYSIGSIGTAAVNQGFDYFIAALDRAQLTDEFFARNLTNDAEEIISLKSGEEAFNLLKRVISAGIPVMVHLDITFIKEAMIANTSYMKFVFAFSGAGHIDHYMTVTGYDGEFVYLNDPTEAADGMGKDIPADISSFLDAWENGNSPAIDESARIGPCWMIFLGERGMAKSAEELIAWNKDIAAQAPDAIKKAADRPNVMPLMHCSEMGRARYEFGTFLKANGLTEAGDIFMEISDLFKGLCQSDDEQADLLRIADLQEEVAGKF
jgi:hypothetical protein